MIIYPCYFVKVLRRKTLKNVILKDQGLVIRKHRKFPYLRHTYDGLKMTTLKCTPLLFQLLSAIVTFRNERCHFVLELTVNLRCC